MYAMWDVASSMYDAHALCGLLLLIMQVMSLQALLKSSLLILVQLFFISVKLTLTSIKYSFPILFTYCLIHTHKLIVDTAPLRIGS